MINGKILYKLSSLLLQTKLCETYYRGISMSVMGSEDYQVENLEQEIAVYDARILKERKKIRKWRKAISREKFLSRELYKIGLVDYKIYCRTLQASINIEKRLPKKILAASRRIERLEGVIWRRNHEKELCLLARRCGSEAV